MILFQIHFQFSLLQCSATGDNNEPKSNTLSEFEKTHISACFMSCDTHAKKKYFNHLFMIKSRELVGLVTASDINLEKAQMRWSSKTASTTKTGTESFESKNTGGRSTSSKCAYHYS